jgi:hypothetical protein
MPSKVTAATCTTIIMASNLLRKPPPYAYSQITAAVQAWGMASHQHYGLQPHTPRNMERVATTCKLHLRAKFLFVRHRWCLAGNNAKLQPWPGARGSKPTSMLQSISGSPCSPGTLY